MTGISQQFCVRWNSHLGSLGAAFPQLLAGQQFVDVTLACDGHQVHCHRLVLAACSSYFESLLSENPCKHPIIILPKDIKLWEIHALVDFMYKGQVNVSQAGLPQLLKCAETLQIRGLCGTDSTLNEVANGKIDRCDSNILPNNCSPNLNFSSMFASNLLNANYQSDDEPQFRQQHSADLQRPTFSTTEPTKTINPRSNDTLVKTKAHKPAHNDKTTKEHSNATLSTSRNSLKRLSENEASNAGSNELNIKCEDVDSDANTVDEGMDDELDDHSNSKQSDYEMQQNDAVIDQDLLIVCDDTNETTRAPQNGIDEHIQDIFAKDNSISITKTETIDDENICYSPSWCIQGDTDHERYNRIDDSNPENVCDVLPPSLPTSLKFNRNTMSISVKRTTVRHRNRLAKRLQPSLSTAELANPTELIEEDNENIICSPNFGQIGFDTNHHGTDTEPNAAADDQFDHLNMSAQHPNENYPNVYHSVDNDVELMSNEKPNDRLMELIRYKDPLRSAVVLRSPRGNQPRSYTTDALYSALMDVKSGESIYRASQIHGVPRKTLRNWMKRWHIKSVYPMPYQLKKAAEKKRQVVQQNETQTSTAAHIDLSECETNEY